MRRLQEPCRLARAPDSPWAPVATVAGAALGCATLALVDPSTPGRYGLCPFYVATSWWCPLCGSLRAVHHLLHGDLAAAAGSNVLLLTALPALAYAWFAWAGPRLGLRAPPRTRLPTGAWWSLLGVLLLFGLLRNLAAFSWLAPEHVWSAG
jgi:hypothetical protein